MSSVLTVPTWNLESLVNKACNPLTGYGWSLDFALDIVEEYRLFCALCRHYPDRPILPSLFVENFWRLHLLDIQHYMEDCEQHYGYPLRRVPFLKSQGSAALEPLEQAWQHTLELYNMQFGAVPTHLWPKCQLTPSYGARFWKNEHKWLNNFETVYAPWPATALPTSFDAAPRRPLPHTAMRPGLAMVL